jgi:protein-L-isoaspartate(D-aspartate) O-methyltransferase
MESVSPYIESSRERLLRDLTKVVAQRRIVEAFAAVPRHLFVPQALSSVAYEDRALPLSHDQTISQPSMIAFMLAQLHPAPTDRALEIGAGCGYAAALLSRLVQRVDTVEIRPPLVALANACLTRAGIDRVFVHEGDGSKGLPERAPFDCILVSAGAERVPDALVEQLAPGGRIAIPVGAHEGGQVLSVGRKSPDGNHVEWLRSLPCLFVPLVET